MSHKFDESIVILILLGERGRGEGKTLLKKPFHLEMWKNAWFLLHPRWTNHLKPPSLIIRHRLQDYISFLASIILLFNWQWLKSGNKFRIAKHKGSYLELTQKIMSYSLVVCHMLSLHFLLCYLTNSFRFSFSFCIFHFIFDLHNFPL